MDVNEMMNEEEWDLGEVLAERKQPKDIVTVYPNEIASFGIAQFKELLKTEKNPEQIEILEDELENLEEDLEASKLIVHLTAVPSRMREDISSKALHTFPVKPVNLMGQDDAANHRSRTQLEKNLLWHAQITDVLKGDKHRRNWTFEEIEQFAESLPTKAQQAIDNALSKLTKDSEEFTVASKNLNFS